MNKIILQNMKDYLLNCFNNMEEPEKKLHLLIATTSLKKIINQLDKDE